MVIGEEDFAGAREFPNPRIPGKETDKMKMKHLRPMLSQYPEQIETGSPTTVRRIGKRLK